MASDILEPGGEYEKDKEGLFKKMKTTTEGDDDNLVHTDNYQDTNNEESEETD